ncbi:NAD(P)/FAD-dependent oxidoreductase [Natronorubrum daqingense]|uniref:FAD-dependent oxidoreductase n=1 Tax=Natronorubrum daqingense TaxID=588898 RepID=A0A1N7ESG5_9EURY|nr:FAD-dependent oxidoreductase [Natronorubrum daqingense]APX97742.1 FAD-dependent oxidoreductase [Natronorubrum daqingense]SIR91053.1 sarcosine oxidase subunit beta [Natronorubrum daqingense]
MKVGIVGGGVYGLAVAYYLSEFGGEDVDIVCFERGSLASESTGYSAGIVRHHYTNPVQIETAIRGRELLEEFESVDGGDGGFRQNGYLFLADPDAEAEFRTVVDRQRRAGLEVELLDADEAASLLPALDPEGVSLAAYEPQAGFADPYLVATGFAAGARDNGVEIRTDTPVTDIRLEGERATGIETPEGVEPVDYVVNAAGAWGGELAEMVGVDVPLEWYESKIVVLQSETSYGPDLPTLSDHSRAPDMYLKPEPSGDFIAGGVDRPPVDRSVGLQGVGESFLRAVGERLEGRVPGYADASVVDSWSGIITVTPDSHQIVGVPKGLENVYNVLGGSGHGFKESPAFGESVALDILGRSPRIDLEAYRLSRFETGDGLYGVSAKSYGGGRDE